MGFDRTMRRMTMSEVAGEVASDRGPAEVWAVAETAYNETRGELVILLASSLRISDGDLEDKTYVAEWLPDREVLRKKIPEERAYSYAQEIFAAWYVKVQRSVPVVAMA